MPFVVKGRKPLGRAGLSRLVGPVISALLVAAGTAPAADAWLRSTPDHADGRYTKGQQITWTIKKEEGPLPDAWNWQVLKMGVPPAVASGRVDLSADPKVSFAAKEPGWMLLVLTEDKAARKPMVFNGGALVDEAQIRAGAREPKDFDAFWKDQLKALADIPMNARETPGESGTPGILYGKVELANINGTLVRGQWAKPEGKGPFPAAVQYQYAGVYPLQKDWVLSYARRGYLALNIMAHDLPIDEPPGFYETHAAGPLLNYMLQGFTNRETTYARRMFLGTRRAIDWIISRPEWNRKTLLVTGTSQGGFQSFAAAGLSPEVTHLAVCVPAGCDLTSASHGLRVGWPYWDNAPAGQRALVDECALYYEPCFFAARTKARALVAVGLIDLTSPASHVLAAFNALPGAKTLVPMPESPHTAKHGEQKAWHEASATFLKETGK